MKQVKVPNNGLRIFSKLTVVATLFLIFAGGMVTSTGSGLAVPDWPLSYGMLFPPMVGGVFYEHGHRMIATGVGALMLVLCVWLWLSAVPKWVKVLGSVGLGTVILQGLLGGLTVLMYLPTPVSVSHGVLAQMFFILTIVLAYSQTHEYHSRQQLAKDQALPIVIWGFCFLAVLIFGQLILAAVMRHAGAGLAIPDFPKMAGQWWPSFDETMLWTINDWRFERNLDPVSMTQVMLHFAHRMMALVITLALVIFNVMFFCQSRKIKIMSRVRQSLWLLNVLLVSQICLGVASVWTEKAPLITSFHVAIGALTLGVTVLAILRSAPCHLSLWPWFGQSALTPTDSAEIRPTNVTSSI